MKIVDVVIIGAGQAGLAMSHELAALGIDHVVLERGRVAERWRSERWDSLRLLTPNWQSRLPGFHYDGPDPDGYMTMPGVIDHLERFAATFDPPVETGTAVTAVRACGKGFTVATSLGLWRTRAVVVATGQYARPMVPAAARLLSPDVVQMTPNVYRRPSDLPAGGVLVVGASATGVQLADELHASGRDVTLAVGRHTRLPRVHRGRDILWWLDRMGLFDETDNSVVDFEASARQPSLQLVGRPDRATLGLIELRARGVRLTGRLREVRGSVVTLDDDLVATTAAADLKLAGVLRRVDQFIDGGTWRSEGGPPVEPGIPPFMPSWPLAASTPQPTRLDLRSEGIRSVLWATGFSPSHPWLHVPVLDQRGYIRHRGGVTSVRGLMVIGLAFLRRRKSAFIDGVGDDARVLAAQLARRLRHRHLPAERRTA